VVCACNDEWDSWAWMEERARLRPDRASPTLWADGLLVGDPGHTWPRYRSDGMTMGRDCPESCAANSSMKGF